MTDKEILRRIEVLLEAFDNMLADRADLVRRELGGEYDPDPYLPARKEAQEAYEALWRKVFP